MARPTSAGSSACGRCLRRRPAIIVAAAGRAASAAAAAPPPPVVAVHVRMYGCIDCTVRGTVCTIIQYDSTYKYDRTAISLIFFSHSASSEAQISRDTVSDEAQKLVYFRMSLSNSATDMHVQGVLRSQGCGTFGGAAARRFCCRRAGAGGGGGMCPELFSAASSAATHAAS
jgi:hypothetical protein